MECRNRKGETVKQNETQNHVLAFLYETKPGRLLLTGLVKPWVSKVGGFLLNRRVSCVLIPSFISKNNIDMSQFESKKYRSYNDFFTRRIKPQAREISYEPEHLIAPCDSKLTVYPIDADARFKIKNTSYTMTSLLRNASLARHYEVGQILVFRLTVDDYHHYCYVDEGTVSKIKHIPGVFHTVNPLANEVYPIYKENTREYSILKSMHFGRILMMEVGALMVGRIKNRPGERMVLRGDEKGYFEFGGSTVILCLEPGQALVDEDILANSRAGIETAVKMGEKIGQSDRSSL